MSVKKQAAAYLLSIDPETERLQVTDKLPFINEDSIMPIVCPREIDFFELIS
jgi:hypothetical protein